MVIYSSQTLTLFTFVVHSFIIILCLLNSGILSAAASTVTKTQPKGIDLDTPGTINGVSVYEFDLDSLQAEEKPWRKPGADITDYFNYGFTEDTWTKYCERQRRLRLENNVPTIGGSNKGGVSFCICC